MVARITSGASPSGATRYNEEKVEKGEAERLAVRNFRGVYLPVEQLDLTTIATKLEERAELNERVKKPTFHASLSFAQGEKPSAEDLLAIADRYMEGMGYAKQPYAVYQHHDTDHTHIHIVSVRVDEQGKKVPDNYERERSNKLRQSIEKEFNLQPAEKVKLKAERIQLNPVEYGQGNLKQDISDVVTGVLRDFKFSSFNQYNQLLGIYNVRATEVPQEGRKPGLVYSALDQNRNAVGATFKASQLPYQPTMETVNRRISGGKKIKGDKVAGVRKIADNELKQSKGWDDFQQRLSKQGVEVMPHQGKDGNLFGISFVDTRSRAIYTGSELSKAFTAGSLKTTLGATYTPPSQRVVPEPQAVQQEKTLKQTKSLDHEQKQVSKPQQNENQPPMDNLDLVRQLLYALGDPGDGQENEHELKQMLRRARKTFR